MAVITCPHCGKYVSSLLTVCPECGNEVSNNNFQSDRHEQAASQPQGTDPMKVDAPAPVAPASLRRLSLRMCLGILSLVLLLSGLTAYFVYNHHRNQALEQRAFERLSGCVDLNFYEDYLVRFPDGEHADEVRDLYDKVKKDCTIYLSATSHGTRDELRQFIKTHPDSPYRKVCELRVDSMDWSVASTTNTVSAYEHYLSLHPDGHFVAAANESKSRQAKLEVTAEEHDRINGLLNSFLTAVSSNDARRIDAIIGTPISFCGKPDSDGGEILSAFSLYFRHSDILGVHFTVPKDIVIRKSPSVSQSGQLDFALTAQVEATLNRTEVDSVNLQIWSVSAQLNPDRKFTSIDMRKVQ